MPSVLTAVVHIAALVLAVAGVGKIIDPRPVDQALRMARWPSTPGIGRAIGAVELAVGAAVLGFGGRVPAMALVVIYTGFDVFIVSTRARGLLVPCGCFGSSSGVPGPTHLVTNGLAVAAGIAAAIWPVPGATDWLDQGSGGAIVLVVAVLAAVAVIVGLEAGSRSSRW